MKVPHSLQDQLAACLAKKDELEVASHDKRMQQLMTERFAAEKLEVQRQRRILDQRKKA